jgi:hypothetical protein
MIDVLDQTEQRLRKAQEILSHLQLFERWQVFGTPILVGAVAYGLAMAPDIDMEIYCDVPRIEDGFTVLRDCALHPNVRKARFGNYLSRPSIDIYRAVIDGGVWTSAQLEAWLELHPRNFLTFWKPDQTNVSQI